jgi:hypothetical protein
MISLLVTILIGWLLLRWLLPRTPVQICEPPPPQLVIHLHLVVPVEKQSRGHWSIDGTEAR